MDVLHILKSDHEALRALLKQIETVEGAKNRRELVGKLAHNLQVHLLLERDYLYPEIVGLFSGSEALVDAGLANAAAILRRLQALLKVVAKPAGEQEDFDKRLAELGESVLKHLDEEERGLMPKIRYMIRTEDREDLGQVFLDVKDELATSGRELLLEEPAAGTSRKRA